MAVLQRVPVKQRFGRMKLKPSDYARRLRQASAARRTAYRGLMLRGRVQLPSRLFARPGELKGVDTDIDFGAGTVLSTTNTNAGIFVLNLIVPGSASFNRIGRKVRLVSVRYQGLCVHQYAATATTGTMNANQIRVLLVWDKQPSGAIPTFDTIFGKTVADGTESTDYLDGLKYDNTGRFRVLRDTRYESSPQGQNENGGTVDAMQNSFNLDEFVKLGNLETVYSGQSNPQTTAAAYRDWETDRKSTRLNSSHSGESRMPSSA